MTPTLPFLLATATQRIGQKLGISPWVHIDQVQVNVFGEVTRWRTPGHCDPEHGKTTRYGGTLLHGFHAISLITHFYKNSGPVAGRWQRPFKLRFRQGTHTQANGGR
jgi:acyl dehydratase